MLRNVTDYLSIECVRIQCDKQSTRLNVKSRSNAHIHVSQMISNTHTGACKKLGPLIFNINNM